MLRIAVTGASGDAGMGALRALRSAAAEAAEPLALLALDAHPERVPPPFYDAAAVLPPVDDPGYVESLIRLLEQHAIDVLLPCIDSETVPLSRARERLRAVPTAVVIAPAELVEAAADKLATAPFLDARGVPAARTWAPDAPASELPFPIVAKPRRGHGSVGVRVLADEAALDAFRASSHEDYCLQDQIDGPELTVGFLYDSGGVLRDAIAMEREIVGGRTVTARVVDDAVVRGFVDAFGSGVAGIGAINAQLRIDPRRGPRVFEINARLSGSTAMRAAVGFNDPIRLVRHFARGESIPRAAVRSATVYRYSSEWATAG